MDSFQSRQTVLVSERRLHTKLIHLAIPTTESTKRSHRKRCLLTSFALLIKSGRFAISPQAIENMVCHLIVEIPIAAEVIDFGYSDWTEKTLSSSEHCVKGSFV